MKKRLMVGLMVLGLSGTAWAGDLMNRDSKKYDLEVSCGSGSKTQTSISGNTTQSGGAGKGCTIAIKGGGSIKASGDKNVVIKNGALSEG